MRDAAAAYSDAIQWYVTGEQYNLGHEVPYVPYRSYAGKYEYLKKGATYFSLPSGRDGSKR